MISHGVGEFQVSLGAGVHSKTWLARGWASIAGSKIFERNPPS